MTTQPQPMDKDWLVYHPNPKKPDFVLPRGSVDAHCHVFGPSAQFPYAPERKYTPGDAGKDKLFELRDFLGFERNVIVQATCHGKDNRAMVDACRTAGDKARGIASVGPDISQAEIEAMDAAGVRGVRFNFVKRLVDATPKEVFLSIADKIKPFGFRHRLADVQPVRQQLVPDRQDREYRLNGTGRAKHVPGRRFR